MEATDRSRDSRTMELRHIGREAKTALELAVVGLCPWDLLERIAAAAGLVDAIAELPLESPAVAALLPKIVSKARAALDEWGVWQERHLTKASV